MADPSVDPEGAQAAPSPAAWLIPNRRFVPAVAFLLSLCLGLVVSFVVDRSVGSGRVLRGVVLREARGDLPLTGAQQADLQDILRARRRELLARNVAVRVGDFDFEAPASALGVDVDESELTRAALHLGRAGGRGQQLFWWLGRLFTVAPVELHLRVDAERLDQTLTTWQRAAFPRSAPPPGVFYDGELRAHYPAPRDEIDRGATRAALLKGLQQEAAPTERLNVPLLQRDPVITRAEVDARLQQARELLSASIRLETIDRLHHLELTPAVLGAALESRLVEHPRPALQLSLSAEKLRGVFDAIRSELERPAQAATFAVDGQHRVTVVPSQPGLRIDEAASGLEVLAAAQRPGRGGVLVLREEVPKLTTEQAEALNVRGLVSQFTTRHPCCEPRVKNIHFAASQADGLVLHPGEQFSLNGLLGPRTNEGGFLDAPAIVRGKMKETPGGGISQFATTLFNAVLDGGYEIIQRQPHTYYFPRYPEGHEATVSYPLPDLVFRNDTETGLLIKTQATPTYIRVLLYGDNEGRRVERHISKRFDPVEPPIEYEPNEKLAPDETKRRFAGQAGWSVVATRVIHYPDGRSAEQRRRVIYRPRPALVEVHPCKIPKGKKGYTTEPCPEPPAEEDFTEQDALPLPNADSEGQIAAQSPPAGAVDPTMTEPSQR